MCFKITIWYDHYIDINECDNETLNKCTDKTTCKNTNGSYTCECPLGSKLGNDGRTCKGMYILYIEMIFEKNTYALILTTASMHA